MHVMLKQCLFTWLEQAADAGQPAHTTDWLDRVALCTASSDETLASIADNQVSRELSKMLCGAASPTSLLSGRTVPRKEADEQHYAGSEPSRGTPLEFDEDALTAVFPAMPRLTQRYSERRFKLIDCTNLSANARPAGTKPAEQVVFGAKRRFEGDAYSPRAVRGKGTSKEGMCPVCDHEVWFKIKQSAYWYHMNFTHGISAVTCKPYSRPIEYRRLKATYPEDNGTSIMEIEGLCSACEQWVMIAVRAWSARVEPFDTLNHSSWFKHAQKCHMASSAKSRKKPKTSTSLC